MYSVKNDSYSFMFGNISENMRISEQCMSQCTGCMCNCRCTCSGGFSSDVEWEEI